MYKIINEDELRFAYTMMLIGKKKYGELNEAVGELKKAIREYHRKKATEDPDKKFEYGDYDSGVELIPVPLGAEMYAEEWFESQIKREYMESQYDCTGQIFTTGHHFVRFRGRLCCIHNLAADV